MALNFPPSTIGGNPPIDGDFWTDPETGRQWQFDGDVPGWKVTAFPGPGVVYRGGIDLTVDPATQFTNIVSGNFFAVFEHLRNRPGRIEMRSKVSDLVSQSLTHLANYS